VLAIVGEKVGEVLLLLLAGELLRDLCLELIVEGLGGGRGDAVHLDDVGPRRRLDRTEQRALVGGEDLRIDRGGKHALGDRLADATQVLRGRVGRELGRDLLPVRI
jgi:hypothetical protein